MQLCYMSALPGNVVYRSVEKITHSRPLELTELHSKTPTALHSRDDENSAHSPGSEPHAKLQPSRAEPGWN